MNTQLQFPEMQPTRVLPPQPPPPKPTRLPNRQTMIYLAVCMALQMTGFVMILPLFARRFSEFGAGVGDLGISEIAYAASATITAPFMGALADRFGRRPLMLVSLAVYVMAFTGYLFATSSSAFIILRALAGALTAGLMPAATSLVADLAPENQRGRWLGILSGGASFGWIAGPIIGGLLYDRWGYATALLVSISLTGVAFAIALLGIREIRPSQSTGLVQQRSASRPPVNDSLQTFRATQPKSLALLMMVLLTYFAVMFAWAFIEPRFMFYAYDDLGWNSSMLGFVMSTYGITMMLGEFGLSRLSDELGRIPVIAAGLTLFSAQFIGLALSRNYIVIALAFVTAGLGNALFDPALSASVLDIAPAEHQARLLGWKSTAGSLGNIAGPALVVIFSKLLSAQGIFFTAAGIVVLATVTVLMASRGIKPDQSRLHIKRSDTRTG